MSATTRNNSPGTYVGLWHFGDIVALQCSARGRHLVRSSRQRIASQSCDQMVGVGRFELPTPCSRSRCATRLRYTPLAEEPWYIDGSARPGKEAGQGHPCIRCSADAMLVGGHPLTIFLEHRPPWLLAEMSGRHFKTRRIGAWPSGKATGFGPVILGSNPSAPATLSTRYRRIFCL